MRVFTMYKIVFVCLVSVFLIPIVLMLIEGCIGILREGYLGEVLGLDKKPNKQVLDEYCTILEMRLNYVEAKERGEVYVADPALICWKYHTIDDEGNIRRKE